MGVYAPPGMLCPLQPQGFFPPRASPQPLTLQFCKEFFLSQMTLNQMSEIKQQLLVLLSELGFVPRGIRARSVARLARKHGSDGIAEAVGPEYNANSSRDDVIKAILTAAFAGNYAYAKHEEAARELGGPPKKQVIGVGMFGRLFLLCWLFRSAACSLRRCNAFRSRPFRPALMGRWPFTPAPSWPRSVGSHALLLL